MAYGKPSAGFVGTLFLAFALGAPDQSAAAQTGELRVDLGASHLAPPSSTDLETATYGIGGVEANRYWASGSGLTVSLLGGLGMSPTTSDWVSGEAEGEAWTSVRDGSRVRIGIGGRVSAFRVGRPFVYETVAFEVTPQVRFTGGLWALLVQGALGSGVTDLEFHRPDGRVRRASNDLSNTGGYIEASRYFSSAVVSVGGGAYRSPAGTYTRGSGSAMWLGAVTFVAGADVWQTPTGTDVSARLGIELPLGGRMSLQVQGGRAPPDPMIRTPQGLSGATFLSAQLVDFTPTHSSPIQIEEGEGGAKVLFRVPFGGEASLSLMGDFTSWEPVPLALEDGVWVVELTVAPGVYHFGFAAGDEWLLPEGTPGVVKDDWGQHNGTLVIPEEL